MTKFIKDLNSLLSSQITIDSSSTVENKLTVYTGKNETVIEFDLSKLVNKKPDEVIKEFNLLNKILDTDITTITIP